MPSLGPDYRVHDAETYRLLALCHTVGQLPSTHQKLVAEIVLLRLFSLFENIVSVVPAKLLCGATFLDGSAPALVTMASSTRGAEKLFRTYGRPRPRKLRWTKATEIRENVRYVMAVGDHFVKTVDRHGAFIDEIRCVRNRIAHNNAGTRRQYRNVVLKHYGAYLNHITPGILLLTPRFRPCMIEQYIITARVLARELVKA